MKLSHWARKHGIPYRTAWKWFKQGILPARAIQLPTGTILVLEEEEEVRLPQDAAAIYTRVSVHEARDDLERQVQRLQDYAAARGYRVVRVVKEVASGLNDRRPRL
ncbi:recombinase family protein, partial [Klebsiella pneumoniae]